MLNIWLIARRELGAIFIQPVAYVFTIAMLLLTGLIFAIQLSVPVIQGGPAPTMSSILSTFTFITIFTLPAVTMRLVSEEQQSGTIELLMTYPVRDAEVVLGKWLAGFIFYLFITAFTLIYAFILIRFGNPDLGPLLSAYLGTLLFGAVLVAVGVMASAMSENQITAFIIAALINLLLYLSFIAADLAAGVFPEFLGFISTVFDELSLQTHFSNMANGLIVATDILYFLVLTAVALFAAARILESRRWR